jgi:phospholipid/cholesterol/gamma-HCH transport system substrate-binding protein
MKRSTYLRSQTCRLVLGMLACVLVLSGCSVYDAPLPGGPDTGKNPIKVTVMFRDVLDLVPQSTVKVNDVTVGKVSKVTLKGYVAKVTIVLPHDIDLPDNATALIRQTSLLGEKFVDLEQPRNPSSKKLSNGDVIGLDRTGRNPEVEEVLGALALLLNGGGVGQLKTIAAELNNAFGGRESDVRSVLDQIRVFTGTLDANKSSIVAALENTNRLAGELRKQNGTIKATLDDVPSALASINRQRGDLVKLLKALTRLSSVGVRVIQASKESTIDSLRDLAPVLNGFAQAGQNFPKSFQVFLTYPFVDDAVGRDPQVARNLHMGDYTNLSVNLDLNLKSLTLPAGPTVTLPPQVCAALNTAIAQIENTPGLTPQQKKAVENALKAGIGGSKCELSGAALQKFIAAILYDVLGPTVTAALCPGAGTTICGLLADPQALPTLTVGPNPLGGVAGAVGGGLGLPRAQLGSGYQVPVQIDPFGLAKHGLDPGVGTLLFQGVATQK